VQPLVVVPALLEPLLEAVLAPVAEVAADEVAIPDVPPVAELDPEAPELAAALEVVVPPSKPPIVKSPEHAARLPRLHAMAMATGFIERMFPPRRSFAAAANPYRASRAAAANLPCGKVSR
jgi:hypothetical protein